jgi:hypothetical protein
MAEDEDIRRARLYRQQIATAKPVTADADPLKALQTSVKESKAQVEKKNIEIPTIALEQAVNTGDKAAIVDAAKAVAKAQGGSATTQASNAIDAVQAATPKPTLNPANIARGDTIKWVGGVNGSWQIIRGINVVTSTTTTKPVVGGGKKETRREFLGAGANRVLRIYYDDGSFQDFPSPDTSGNGGNGGDGGDGGDGNGTSVFGSVTGTSTTRTLGRDQFKNSLALFFGAAEAAKPWVDALYDVVSKFYRTGSSVDESFNLALQDARNNPALKPFTDRFKGIYALQDLKLTGKPVLVPTIAEYVVSQAKMADVLREANLGDLATDDFTTELISKGNSVTTIAEKIAKVYQRIDMAPKAIKDTLGRYFPTVDRTTLAKTLLTGQKGVDQLVDELEQYEVLAAAERQGLGAINRIGGVDLGRAQEYARSGQTYASLTPKFSQIARALPTTTKLSQISKLEDIGQVGLEKALISQSAKELEQLELLGEQEIARYSGKAGRAELGLASQRRANRAY